MSVKVFQIVCILLTGAQFFICELSIGFFFTLASRIGYLLKTIGMKTPLGFTIGMDVAGFVLRFVMLALFKKPFTFRNLGAYFIISTIAIIFEIILYTKYVFYEVEVKK